jgi:dihydroorotate dehydrogenase (NAD+) catalytic subunit
LKAAAIDPATLRPWLGAGRGGLSGPAVRAVAVEQVRAVSTAVGIPVIGMGGVTNGADALEMIAAGATLVAVGTENFRDPAAGSRVAAELANLLEQRGFDGAGAARGASLDSPAGA